MFLGVISVMNRTSIFLPFSSPNTLVTGWSGIRNKDGPVSSAQMSLRDFMPVNVCTVHLTISSWSNNTFVISAWASEDPDLVNKRF
jgi:hypothetical protein